MITTDIDYLDGEFTVSESEPNTIDECKELIGEAGVVDETTSNLRYRNKYPRVYKLVSAAVVALGFARGVKETKTLKDGTTKDVLVDATAHLRAFMGSSPENKTKLGELFTQIAPEQPLYVKGERTGGSGKISEAAMAAANSKFAAGSDAVDKAIAIIEANVPGYKIGRDADGEATPESLARGISALNKHLAVEAAKQTKVLLG